VWVSGLLLLTIRGVFMKTQISAYISDDIKILFEDFLAKSALSRDFAIEQAVLYYINAHQEFTSDIIIPPSITISEEVLDNVVMVDREPTKDLTQILH